MRKELVLFVAEPNQLRWRFFAPGLVGIKDVGHLSNLKDDVANRDPSGDQIGG